MSTLEWRGENSSADLLAVTGWLTLGLRAASLALGIQTNGVSSGCSLPEEGCCFSSTWVFPFAALEASLVPLQQPPAPWRQPHDKPGSWVWAQQELPVPSTTRTGSKLIFFYLVMFLLSTSHLTQANKNKFKFLWKGLSCSDNSLNTRCTYFM